MTRNGRLVLTGAAIAVTAVALGAFGAIFMRANLWPLWAQLLWFLGLGVVIARTVYRPMHRWAGRAPAAAPRRGEWTEDQLP